MSLTKSKIEEKDRYYELAKKILMEIGEIKACDVHDDYFYETYENDENIIYAKATEKIKSKISGLIDYKIFHEQIQKVLADASASSKCPFCEKSYNE